MKNVVPDVKKLNDRTTAMIFVGYEDGAKAYHIYNPRTKWLYVIRDMVFEEDRRWNWEDSGDVAGGVDSLMVITSRSKVETAAMVVKSVARAAPNAVPESPAMASNSAAMVAKSVDGEPKNPAMAAKSAASPTNTEMATPLTGLQTLYGDGVPFVSLPTGTGW